MISQGSNAREESPEDGLAAKPLHDVKASLAILNGYGDALDSSFSELCSQMDAIVSDTTLLKDQHTLGQLKTLEADCRFCLSRIRSSAGQLKERLETLKSSH